MERFFTPVHGLSEDEAKIHKHYQPIPNRHPHNNHYHHNQYHQHGSHSHSSSRNREKHRNIHDHHHNDNRHQPYHHKYPKIAGAHHGFTKTSSSSLSSSSCPTSSASWTSEPSDVDETYLTYNKPQHSLSCSNISEAQWKIIEDFDHRDPLHGQNRRQRSFEHSNGQLLPSSQHGHRAPKLCRGHSKSEEGLQQNWHRDSEESHPMEHGALYKTASLVHSLALGENLSKTSKKAASSIQLPSKGILKNKDEGQNRGNFRKSKSMEVLSTRVQVTKTSKQSSTEVARHNVVKGKLQFSALLDEITRQVISPSTLSSLGLTPPKSPNEELKQYADKLMHESTTPPPKQQTERPDSRKTATDSSTCSRSQEKGRQHQDYYHDRNLTGLPTPLPRHPSKAERRGATSDKHPHMQYSQLLTDGISISPEPTPKHKERQSAPNPARQLHTKQEQNSSSLPPLRTPGSSTSASSEKSDKAKHMGHRRHSRTHRDSASAVDTVRLLERYNKELHENLLQMVSCIENMEAQLQCTKTELVSFKEKYKRLQESYSASQQANSVLEQKQKSVVDSLDSERKFLRQRVVDLTNQMETAQKTISSLENINVPSLIRELLKKPFDSKDVLEHLSNPQTLPTQSVTDQSNRAQEFKDSHSFDETGEESVFEWLGTGQSSSGQSFSKQPATAFLPWKNDPWAGPDPLEVKGSDTLFSVTDDVSIYKAMADAKSSTHQAHPFGKNTEFHSVAMPTHSCVDVPPNPFNLKEMRLHRETGGDLRDEGPVTVRKDPNDFNYLTAQRMLEDFFSQIPPPALDGKEKDRLEAVMGAREKKEGNY